MFIVVWTGKNRIETVVIIIFDTNNKMRTNRKKEIIKDEHLLYLPQSTSFEQKKKKKQEKKRKGRKEEERRKIMFSPHLFQSLDDNTTEKQENLEEGRLVVGEKHPEFLLLNLHQVH